ncbi:MAG: hypothetical protein LBC44_04570 [Mycoplasmataceae bacterium]|nr:hypothetical protein [Mycoplasmataceae bacterium]
MLSRAERKELKKKKKEARFEPFKINNVRVDSKLIGAITTSIMISMGLMGVGIWMESTYSQNWMIVVGGVMCGITFVILFTVLFFRVRENKRIQRVEEEFKIEQRRDAILKAKLEREERKIVEENRKMEEKAKREKPIEWK